MRSPALFGSFFFSLLAGESRFSGRHGGGARSAVTPLEINDTVSFDERNPALYNYTVAPGTLRRVPRRGKERRETSFGRSILQSRPIYQYSSARCLAISSILRVSFRSLRTVSDF